MIPKTLTGILRSAIIKMKDKNEIKRTEARIEIQTYLDRLKYAIENGSAVIEFAKERYIDKERNKKHTNKYTMSVLFPDEDFVTALKKELIKLTVEEYIETVKDINRPKYSEFSSVHASGGNYIFVMSFYFAEFKFNEEEFPYKKD